MENSPLHTLPAASSHPSTDPWSAVLAAVRPRVTRSVFETWFRNTRFAGRDGDRLLVSVPNAVCAQWMESTFRDVIGAAMRGAGMEGARVEFVPDDARAAASAGQPACAAEPRASEPAPPTEPPAREAGLNPRYTFASFVPSKCNEIAHAAALSVARQPAEHYNPLYIHGATGLGKTHLLQAIGNALLERQATIRVRYLTSEEFVNELITAIRDENTREFRRRYRSVDVLLVDDVQFLARKRTTQEEFFHTFNSLYEAGRQIVLASDCLPHEVPQLEARLKSRFAWGLMADIQPPDFEAKVAIIEKMAEARRWEIPTDVRLFLAGQPVPNVRELEGLVRTVVHTAEMKSLRRPDMALARMVASSRLPALKEQISIDSVLRVVARRFGLKPGDLKTRTNARRIAYPRQIAMYLAKKLTEASYPAIGDAIGGKHHTTVIHACRKIDARRAADADLERLLTAIEEELA